MTTKDDSTEIARQADMVMNLYNVVDYAPQLDTLRKQVWDNQRLRALITDRKDDKAIDANIDRIIRQAVMNVIAGGNNLYREEEIDFISSAISAELEMMGQRLESGKTAAENQRRSSPGDGNGKDHSGNGRTH